MPLTTPRLKREHLTMQRMVEIYCRDHHGASAAVPCADCNQFLDYAEQRLEKCPYGEGKPTCAKCPIHCYKRAQREQARVIMRYAGPRMTFRIPGSRSRTCSTSCAGSTTRWRSGGASGDRCRCYGFGST